MNAMRFPKARGQELVEYAMILPIFVFLILGILDLGRAVYYYSAINNGAREGARYGSIHLEEANVEANICNLVIHRTLGLGLTCDPLDPTPDVSTIFNFDTEIVKVTVSYSFKPVTPIIGRIFGGASSVPLSTSSIMQLEYVP